MLIFLSSVGTLLAWSVLPKFRMEHAASIYKVNFRTFQISNINVKPAIYYAI